ncbi:MAG TPA: hypothetical protein VHK69_05440 [Chitinophagaceae bacterium]|jgi:hypothetical protein|nr:hypothetical protein [Chitinophagaceae bacterium]
MAPFDIAYRSGSFTFRFSVEWMGAEQGLERFRLTGGGRTVILQSNRPLLLARGLKKKAVYWKVVEGKVQNGKALEDVTRLIEKKLRGEDISPKPRTYAPRTPFQVKSRPPWRNKSGEGPTLGERNQDPG